ncbi:autotransporter outer membrane beta-barrel domain-containing protein [Allosphingosinicella sp.]|uniref:autotransporter outer membrane beta-barrel domain-containing protein n=1 Tax=Allosphingosinicella sp. TaxID=2823234 RepID=UPI002ED844D2
MTPAAICLAMSPAFAETKIEEKRTTNVRTSTVNNGAADSIRITSKGSVEPAGGVAVTIDSNHSVFNDGKIEIEDANDVTGIYAGPGITADITNDGSILIVEDVDTKDTDSDNDNDGPFAVGSNRFGIRIGQGGTFAGTINNSGGISIEGNDSGGIQVDSRLAGSLLNEGSISLFGDNSYGIRAKEVTGNVGITGSIFVQGANSVGVSLEGNIGGALTVQSSVAATGYRYTSSPSDTSKLDADDLLQGGAALKVTGNVAGGILLDVRPADNDKDDKDEDDDGINDADEGSAAVLSYGAAPAMEIGAANRHVAIGAVAKDSSGHGLVIKGAVAGSGVYSGIDGNGLIIGGQGGSVSIAGGMTVTGSVAAASVDSNATALRIGRSASVPEIRITGAVGASSKAKAGASAQAVVVEAGATVRAIHNSGSIEASASSGSEGAARAIVDRSGTLGLITNSGSIRASASSASADAIAIDLRANNAGAVVRQTAVSGKNAPEISGNILFGTGADTLDVRAGKISGDIHFGSGADTFTLENGSFSGQLAGSPGLALSVTGSTLDVTNRGTVALSSLSLSGQSKIGVTIDSRAGTHTMYDVAGRASFSEGSTVLVKFADTATTEGRHVIVRAGELVGGSNLTNEATVPFMYVANLNVDQAAREVGLTVRRKNAGELGLNTSEKSAYDAVYAALSKDEDVEDLFLNIQSGDAFRTALRQMLPDHAGGAFGTALQASGATTRFLADPRAPIARKGSFGFMLQQVGWGSSKDIGDTAAYDISGWGFSGGGELKAGDNGAFGLMLSYLMGKDADGSTNNEVQTTQYELGGYWRGSWNALNAFARASAAYIAFDSSRSISGSTGSEQVEREAEGNWNGTLWSAGAGISYELRAGRISLRPTAVLDYYSLSEDGYAEKGGGKGFDLTVDGRKSSELAASMSASLGFDFLGANPDGRFFRVELEGGRREILSGSLGSTTARYEGGNDFTLEPGKRISGWTGKLRAMGGDPTFRLGGQIGAEEQEGRAAIDARLTLNSTF